MDKVGYRIAHSPVVAKVVALVATGAASETQGNQIFTWVHNCQGSRAGLCAFVR